ncbi:Predicted amidohydrolase [Alteromonadaceae bacterium Bs31]|nr:Predicted amidohydrolase [Alteromonadaceae bacterium Bs31]
MEDPTLQIAAIQLVSEANIASNLASVEKLLKQAKLAGAQLAVLPENVLTFGQQQSFDRQAQMAWLKWFSAQAQQQKMWIVAGSMPLQAFEISQGGSLSDLQWSEAASLPYATSVVFNSNGAIEGVYRKIHLFDAQVNDATARYRESEQFCAGGEPAVIETPWGKMGLGICYDLRFPEYFRLLRQRGADFVVLPSAFTYATGAAHWEILLRARAIENQSHVIGVNQGGEHKGGRSTWGDSMIVDPWGDVLARVGDAVPTKDSQLGEHIVIAQMDLASQRALRERMPSAQHQKFFI